MTATSPVPVRRVRRRPAERALEVVLTVTGAGAVLAIGSEGSP